MYTFDKTVPFKKNEYKARDDAAPMFNTVCIQTVSTCSKSCVACPANSISGNNLANGTQFMDWNLFEKIVNDLVSIKYTGAVAMYLYSEPYMEKTYEKRLKYVRDNLPKCSQNVYTNGDFLTKDRIIESMKYLNFLWINAYSQKDEEKLLPMLEEVRSEHPEFFGEDNGLQNKTSKSKTVRFKRAWHDGKPSDSDGHWNNRGGLLVGSNLKKLSSPLKRPCTQPFRMFFLDWQGNTRQCCSDWHGENKIGNVRDTHVLDLWNSIQLQRVRKSLINKNRVIPMCVDCDYKGGPYQHMLSFNDTIPEETVEEASKNLWQDYKKNHGSYKDRQTVDTDADPWAFVKQRKASIANAGGTPAATPAESDAKVRRVLSIKRATSTFKEVTLTPRVPLKTKEEKSLKKKKVWKEGEKMSFKNMNSMKRLQKRGVLPKS